MGKIKILTSDIYNKIAAGEVVERPASVVKELLENSIDAGATHISVEIAGGGTKRIIVSDNGCGMDAKDLELAFSPHATSKINAADDLFKIGTLGFRGEALPSIASVSKVTVISREAGAASNGEMIVVEGGKITGPSEKGSPAGTKIIAEDLFYNVPARAKFLKSVNIETAEITNVVSRLILANPGVSIKYGADGVKILHSAGQGIEAAMLAVYGLETIKQCCPVGYAQNGVKISGFVGMPGFSKPNRSYQTLIVNGRYCIDTGISDAVAEACGDVFMKRQFPFYVLHLEISPDALDVNVHPAKMRLRFLNFGVISGAVRAAVVNALEKQRKDGGKAVEITAAEKTASAPAASSAFYESPSFFNKSKGVAEDNNISRVLYNLKFESASETAAAKQTEAPPEQVQIDVKLPGKILGTAFNTYILIEHGEGLYLIDQHAAHERILYDKLTAQYEKNNVMQQPLLIPFVFNVNPAEFEILAAAGQSFKEIGIILEAFGPAQFCISAVPALLSSLDLNFFVNNILGNITAGGLAKEKLMRAACKAAVKGGDKLNNAAVEYLLNLISKGNITLTCPHGRPIITKLSKSEIEKWFKRKV